MSSNLVWVLGSKREAFYDSCMLTPEDIDEFQALMRNECGMDLSREEATAMAWRLISLLRIVLEKPEDGQAGFMPLGGVRTIWKLFKRWFGGFAWVGKY